MATMSQVSDESKHFAEGNSSPRPSRAASMLRNGFGARTLELLVVLEMAIAFLCVPSAVLVLVATLRHDTNTIFWPDDDRRHWVAGPTRRGTMNIIWLCLSTIYTCVHVSVHLDVLNTEQNAHDFQHAVEKSRIPRWTKTLVNGFMNSKIMKSRGVRHGVWVCFNIFAPEVVVMVALLELISAHDAMRFMHSYGQEDWNMTLAFFADMGGFGQLKDGMRSNASANEPDAPEPVLAVGTDHGVDEVCLFRNGLEFLGWFQQEAENGRRFTKKQLKLIEAEIKDRSDRSLLLKLITFSQASWFFIETMKRLAAPTQAVSQMEVATCAYIFCTLITYLCWFYKPYHIAGHVILPRHLSPREDGSDTAARSPRLEFPVQLIEGARFTPFNRSFLRVTHAWILSATVSGVVGAFVGAIHGAPLWQAQLIDSHGQWLWRTCSILQFALPLAVSSSSIIEQIYNGKILLAIAALLSFTYAVSRFVVIGLVYISFWSLPDTVYNNVDWSWAYFPHWH